MSVSHFRRLLAAACALVATSGLAQQQPVTEEATLINWWYSATFGTGFYKIGPAVATVVRLPFSYRLRDMGDGSVGVNLLAPVTVAAYHLNLHELNEFDLQQDVAAASFLPGAEVEIPMTERWRLRPFAQAGMGSQHTDPTLVAYMYTGGVRSLYRFPGEEYRVSLGTALFAAGFRVRDGSERQGLGVFQLGLNMETNWSVPLWNGPAYLNWHFISTAYYPKLTFADPEPGQLSVIREYQAGFSFRTAREIKFLGFGADTLGLGFRFAHNVRGLSVYTEFPF